MSVECKFIMTQSKDRYHMGGIQVVTQCHAEQSPDLTASAQPAEQVGDQSQAVGTVKDSTRALCPRPPPSAPRPAPNKFRPRISSAKNVPERSGVSPQKEPTNQPGRSANQRIRPMTARKPLTNRSSRPFTPKRRPLTARVNQAAQHRAAHYGEKSRQPLYRDQRPRSPISDRGLRLKLRWSAKGYEYLLTE